MSDSRDRKWKPLRDFGPTESQGAEGDGGEIPLEEDLSPLPAYVPERIGPPVDEAEERESDEETVPDAGEYESDIAPEAPASTGPDRVLLVQPAAATTRLIRETLENFTRAEVVATSDPLRGFELALQREYRLFLFGMQVGELSGPMLYELISKTYSSGWAPARLAPGVIFIRDSGDPQLPEELNGDVRVKAIIHKPIRIDRLLQSVGTSIDVLDPTTGRTQSSGS